MHQSATDSKADPQTQNYHNHQIEVSHRPDKGMFLLSLGALGVVFGDIGTSPLYALNLMFFGAGPVSLNSPNILGGISLVIWALTVVVAFKYSTIVLRADNDGEGGVFALYGLLDKFNKGRLAGLSWMLLAGAGLLFGDGVITPAISVLSAIEGIGAATPVSSHTIVLVTIIILTFLFSFQYKGTGGLGRIFGPIIIVWFVVLAILGVHQIRLHPEIFRALNPLYGLQFLLHGGWRTSVLVLGALVLVLTGGEAMYANMGHFGARPIRYSWFLMVYPALILNYLGQGAFLLGGGQRVGGNLFYSMVPSEWMYPMVVLATMATVIASQALISGAFSLASQAIALEVLPRLKVKHTHHDHAGQVYLPFINWSLYWGAVILVIAFGSSESLGAAYGLAESGVMLTTSVSMFFIARRYWHWSVMRSALMFGCFALVETTFLAAKATQFLEGGFVPVLIGSAIFITMATWRWGRKATFDAYAANYTGPMSEMITHHREQPSLIERTAILMVPVVVHSNKVRTPTLLQMMWKRTGALPRNIICVQVKHLKIPFIHGNRHSVHVLERNERGSIIHVQMQFGFMEDPNVEIALQEMLEHQDINLPNNLRHWGVHVAVENLIADKAMSWLSRMRLEFFILLRTVSRPAYFHYGLGNKVALSAEIFPIDIQ